MRKSVHIAATALATAALVGTGAGAASADGPDHHGYGSFGSATHSAHRHFGDPQWARPWSRHDGTRTDRHPAYRPTLARHDSTSTASTASQGAPDRTGGTAPATPPTAPVGARSDHTPTPSAHQLPTFEQRKAAVVAALTALDQRLTALQNRLESDSNGFAAAFLPYVTKERATVESLLSQAQSATTQQELDAILAQMPHF